MAKLIKTDGTTQEVYPSDKENGFSLEELYKLIECDTIDCLRLPNNMFMVLDDEGLLKVEQKINWEATSIIEHITHTTAPIVGNVVICNDKEFQ